MFVGEARAMNVAPHEQTTRAHQGTTAERRKRGVRRFGPFYAVGIFAILGLNQLESRIGKDTVHMIAGISLVGVLGAVFALKWKNLRK